MVDLYRVFHPIARQYIFFYAAHGNFYTIDHTLGHKASLNKFNKIEITPCIISDHNGKKLDLKNKVNHGNLSKMWGMNNTLLKDQWVTEEIREEIKKFLEFNKN
jgi:hypothetical protein